MSEQYGNQSLPTTLVSPLASGDMAATVVDATGLPTSGPFRIIVGTDIANEIIIVGAITGTSLSSLTRHAEGTSAADWPAGTPVSHVLTAGSFEQGITDSMDAHEADSGAHPQYVLGSDVGVSGGIAQLDGSGKVPDGQIPAAITRDTEFQAADAAHEADATNVHGITNTANLETTTGAQTKADAAVTTAEGYADTKDAAHVAAGDPHAGYRLESAAIGTTDLADDSVTLAKVQNLTTDRLLGRDTTGTGDPEQLTVGGGVEFSGSGGIQRSALTGEAAASAGSNATTVSTNHAGSRHVAWKNVLDYGTPNGVDDTAMFNSARDAAAASGGVIYAPGGHTYFLDDFQLYVSQLALVGDTLARSGGPSTIIKAKAGAAQAIRIEKAFLTTIRQCRLENLRLEGNGTSGSNGVKIVENSRLHRFSNIVFDTLNTCVQIGTQAVGGQCDSNIFENCEFANSTVGVWTNSANADCTLFLGGSFDACANPILMQGGGVWLYATQFLSHTTYGVRFAGQNIGHLYMNGVITETLTGGVADISSDGTNWPDHGVTIDSSILQAAKIDMHKGQNTGYGSLTARNSGLPVINTTGGNCSVIDDECWRYNGSAWAPADAALWNPGHATDRRKSTNINGTVMYRGTSTGVFMDPLYKSGAGVTNLVDGDFPVTPGDGTRGTAHNTTTGLSYSCVRANGTWKSVEVS